MTKSLCNYKIIVCIDWAHSFVCCQYNFSTFLKKNINIHIKIRAYIVLLLVKSKIKDTILIHQIILVCRATVEAAE